LEEEIRIKDRTYTHITWFRQLDLTRQRYCKFLGIPFALSISKRVFAFGVDKRNSLGIPHMILPTPNDSIIMLEVDVVLTNVPMLLGFDVLDKFGLSADTRHNVLHCTAEDWNLPLVRKLGHVYLEWSATDRILYTKSELQKLHRNFSHPSTQNLFELHKRAKVDNVDANTRAVLSDIENACSTCQRYSSKPLRPKTTLPSGEELHFGSELLMDPMFINGKAVLHFIDSATRLNAATFLDSHSESYGQSSDGIRDSFIDIWCSIYTGYPERLRIDSESTFTSVKWKTLTEPRGITLRISGVEAHNSLGIGERYHGPLRRLYQKSEHEFPHVGPVLLL
jgi:hypothetical protein